MATQVSAIGFMSIPAKSYAINWSYFSGVFTWFLVVPIVTWAFIPFFRKLDVTSAYEYLEKRFNEFIRLFSGFIYCIYQLGRMGLIVYLPAVALSAVAPIDTFTCILIMGVLSTLYTVVGGIEAVIWIEVLQVALLMGGAITCVVLAITSIDGGVSGFVDIAMENDKFSLGALDFDFTSSVLGVVLIGNIFTRLGNLISDQAIVQRYMTTKDLKTSKKSLWMDVIVSIPWAIIIYLLSTSLYVFYKSNPELLNPAVPTDGILPQFISQQAPSGLSGLIIAAIFAAAMANIESHIHSMATIATTDFYGRFSKSVTEKKKLRFARITTAILGVEATCLAMLLLTIDIKSILDVFTEMTGLFLGAAAGLFLLGIFTEKANSTCAIIGALGSSILLYFIQTETRINFWLYSAIGITSCFVIGYLSSFIFTGKKDIQGPTIFSINKKLHERHTVAEQQIEYPTDLKLLNESREQLETMIKKLCKQGKLNQPRMYKNKARQQYLTIAIGIYNCDTKTTEIVRCIQNSLINITIKAIKDRIIYAAWDNKLNKYLLKTNSYNRKETVIAQSNSTYGKIYSLKNTNKIVSYNWEGKITILNSNTGKELGYQAIEEKDQFFESELFFVGYNNELNLIVAYSNNNIYKFKIKWKTLFDIEMEVAKYFD